MGSTCIRKRAGAPTRAAGENAQKSAQYWFHMVNLLVSWLLKISSEPLQAYDTGKKSQKSALYWFHRVDLVAS